MKTILLLVSLLFVAALGYSQTAIEQIQSAAGSNYVEVTGNINEATTGANVLWDFTGLTTTATIKTDIFTNTPPNSSIQTNEGATLIAKIDFNTTGGQLAITSVLSNGFQLNYSNFGVIGNFPLSFGYANSDAVEGTFTSGSISGSVVNTSTINVAVDAWGTLKVGTFNGEVTRLKIIQNLNLLVSGFIPAAGTQTSYFYYDANSNDLVFRSTRFVVPLAGLDTTILESLSTYTLGIGNNQVVASQLYLITNPVQDVLSFSVSNLIEIQGITILDVSGRVVLKSDTNAASIVVNHLKSGLFFATITTNKGIVTKKFIKH